MLNLFAEYVRSGKAFTGISNYEMYAINDLPVMDEYIDYGNLKAGLGKLTQMFKLPESLYEVMNPIKAKGSNRSGTKSYPDYYGHDQQLIELVALACAREIKLFDYSFMAAISDN